MAILPISKGPTRKTLKGRKKRAEARVVSDVRPKVVNRDGYCRAGGKLMGPCEGESEWAHLGDHKRSKTRGMPPEERHTTKGSCMLCTKHHGMEERHEMDVEMLTDDGADGPMSFQVGSLKYTEPG